MNQISTMSLNTLTSLFQQKEATLKHLLGDLQLHDVIDNNAFSRTLSEIKRQVLLDPVTIGTPKIMGSNQATQWFHPIIKCRLGDNGV